MSLQPFFKRVLPSAGISKMLISRGQAKINVKNSDGRTPLHLSMTSNSIVLINTLIQSGAEVNAKDLSNRTALMIAAHSGHYRLVSVKYHDQGGELLNSG